MKLLRIQRCYLVALSLLVVPASSGLLAQISEKRGHLNELQNGWDKEQAAIKKIKELGGWVELENCVPAKWNNQVPRGKRKFVVKVNMVYHEDKETGVRSDNSNYSDECLDAIKDFTQVKRIYLTKTQASDAKLGLIKNLKHVDTFFVWDASLVSDKGLKNISNFKNLKSLHLSNSQITSDGIGYLTKLKHIERLSLQDNAFSNDVVKHASNFKKLKSLWVGSGPNTIDDEGLKHLAGMKNLETLGMQKIRATDEGLALISKLPKLKKFYISGSKITAAGIAKLQSDLDANRKLDSK